MVDARGGRIESREEISQSHLTITPNTFIIDDPGLRGHIK